MISCSIWSRFCVIGMAVGDRVSRMMLYAVCAGTICSVFLTSALRKADKQRNGSLFDDNLQKFRGK